MLVVAEAIGTVLRSQWHGVWVPAYAGTTDANLSAPQRSRRLPDLEAREIVVGLGGIERLAHHRKRLVRRRGRRQPHLHHHLAGVGREIDLLGDLLVIHIALDLA